MRLCQIQHNFTCSSHLCKLGREYLNAVTCKFYTFFGQNLETFDISHAFLPLTIETVQVFGPPRTAKVDISWTLCGNFCRILNMVQKVIKVVNFE